MTIVVERKHDNRQAGMVFGTVAESFHLIHKHEAERAKWEWCGFLKHWILPPVMHHLYQVHTSQSFTNCSTKWRPSILIYEPTGVILIQTIMRSFQGSDVCCWLFLIITGYIRLTLIYNFKYISSYLYEDKSVSVFVTTTYGEFQVVRAGFGKDW